MSAPTGLSRPLKVGLVLPHIEDWMSGGTARWSDLLAMAKAAEAIGFDSVWVVDHVLYQHPLDDPSAQVRGVWDGWSLLAALAAATTRVELGTAVTCVPFRNPALLAKMADTIDEISNGRVILGLGAGYYQRELDAFGFPSDRLGSRFEEAILIISGLLRNGAVDFAGTHYQARECELRPRGPRPQGPPLVFGARGDRMLRVTAQHADGWSWSSNTPERSSELRARVDAACLAAGRDPATLARMSWVALDLPGFEGTPSVPWVKSFRESDEPPLRGSYRELAHALRALASEGVSHVQLHIEPSTLAGVEACQQLLAELDRAAD